MNVSEFERAVVGLNCSLELDAIRLGRGGHVRKGFARKACGHGCMLVMWDELGRGFSTVLHSVSACDVTDETYEGVSASCYERDKVFDLKQNEP